MALLERRRSRPAPRSSHPASVVAPARGAEVVHDAPRGGVRRHLGGDGRAGRPSGPADPPASDQLVLVAGAGSATRARTAPRRPSEPSSRIGWTRPSQPLKSPTTRTARALGAHTAKATPATPWWLIGRGRRAPPTGGVAALAEQVEVELAEGRQEPVGVVDDLAVAVGQQHLVAGRRSAGRRRRSARRGRPGGPCATSGAHRRPRPAAPPWWRPDGGTGPASRRRAVRGHPAAGGDRSGCRRGGRRAPGPATTPRQVRGRAPLVRRPAGWPMRLLAARSRPGTRPPGGPTPGRVGPPVAPVRIAAGQGSGPPRPEEPPGRVSRRTPGRPRPARRP